MIVLDAFAVIAFLRGEPAAPVVSDLLVDGAALTAPGLAEVVDHLVRVMGIPDEEAALDVAQLGLADAIVVGADLGLRAGLLRARHYHRTSRAVSLIDCVAAESARALRTQLATADPHLLDLCRDEGVGLIPLPDRGGDTRIP